MQRITVRYTCLGTVVFWESHCVSACPICMASDGVFFCISQTSCVWSMRFSSHVTADTYERMLRLLQIFKQFAGFEWLIATCMLLSTHSRRCRRRWACDLEWQPELGLVRREPAPQKRDCQVVTARDARSAHSLLCQQVRRQLEAHPADIQQSGWPHAVRITASTALLCFSRA